MPCISRDSLTIRAASCAESKEIAKICGRKIRETHLRIEQRRKRIYPFNPALGQVIVLSNHEQILTLFPSARRRLEMERERGCAVIRMDFIVAILGECRKTKPDTINLRARYLLCDFLLANCENSKRSRGRWRRVRLSTYLLALTHLFGNSKGQLE